MRRVLFYFGDFIIFNTKKIFGIIITSSILGLVINIFNPAGIPLIREQVELKWAPDSLFQDQNTDTVKISEKSNSTTLPLIDESNSKTAEQSKVKSKEEVISVQKESKNIVANNKDEENIVEFTEPKAITVEQAYSLYKKNVTFIDARDESDFFVGHITNATNIPFDDFDNHQGKLEQISKEKPLVVYCAGTDCDLSHLLANLLFEKGFRQVYVFFGGWVEWSEANYPIEHNSDTN